MIYRRLGRTSLEVSALALGTVALGTEYGIAAATERPPERQLVGLITHAADLGISLFDTAPAYGISERLLGIALEHRPSSIIATKVLVPGSSDRASMSSSELRKRLEASLQASRVALRRDKLDLVQIHNATPETLDLPEVKELLADYRSRGIIGFLGASVYSVDEALAAIATDWVDVIQVPFSILDQRMRPEVFEAARAKDVGIIVRSALVKGALSVRANRLPPALWGLRDAADRVRNLHGITWDELPRTAVRFCLSDPRVGAVLVGASNDAELTLAIQAVDAPVDPSEFQGADALGLTDERLIDPRHWPST